MTDRQGYNGGTGRAVFLLDLGRVGLAVEDWQWFGGGRHGLVVTSYRSSLLLTTIIRYRFFRFVSDSSDFVSFISL